jgi:L-alanine-DL-glutamate epimerase-like enolase superfamily enzyme
MMRLDLEAAYKDFDIRIIPRTLHALHMLRTSRGAYRTRRVWYMVISSKSSGEVMGVGECAPLPGLSWEYCTDLSKKLQLRDVRYMSSSSAVFALESALTSSCSEWGNNPFMRGEKGIQINGLIWMDNYRNMYRRIEEKLKRGFHCVKLKIGSIDFDDELGLLQLIRRDFSSDVVQLRVDANGAFTPEEALEKLKRLSDFDLHSIEQPIKAGQYNIMGQLCRKSPIPIALDEELINHDGDKETLLDTICPAYLVLKPSLHGGMSGCDEWIKLAKARGIGFWVTSAIESNVGLTAIARWCSRYVLELPQGLGTGLLFKDNVDSPLELRGEELWYKGFSDGRKSWTVEELLG